MQSQLIAGRYQVLRAIGRGGMGTVWLCRDEVLGREVAVKQMGALPGESATETKRAMREARSAAALNHPNAVAVYDVVNHDERPWLVMEYVEGQTLADEISRDGQLSPRRVADIGAQLAGALARAHERRIVHRDIKPANVLIDKAGRPKISDFGIARGHGDDQLTQIGFVTGTPGYLSPELARGEDPHSASDVWALGATLYAAVEGRSPYEPRSNPIALLRAIATEPPRPMTHAGALGPAINAMMHEDPDCRWDMATSAKKLGGIAAVDGAAVMPRVQPTDTAVMPFVVDPAGTVATPPVESTRRFETASPAVGSTQRLEAAALPVESTKPTETVAPTTVESTKPMKTVAATTAESAKPVEAVAPTTVESTTKLETVAPPAVESTTRFEAAAPAVGSTQRLETTAPPVQSTKRFEAAAPLVAAAAAVRPEPAGTYDLQGGAPVHPPGDRKSGRRWMPLVYVALLVAALGVVYLLSQLGDPAGTTAVLAKPSVTAPARTTAPVAEKTTEQPSTATRREHKDLQNFVSSYYSDVTKDTDRTWDRLSPRMQDTAGGRHSYDAFWATIDKVKVNETRPNASGAKAVVNLTFTRDDGTKSTETHQFTFLTVGEDFLIDSDQFLG